MTTGFDWAQFLHRWNGELLRSRHIAETLQHALDDDLPAAVEAGWLGFPPATPAQLAATEARLGTTLPPSYKAFLAVSNGWQYPTTFIPKLWSCEEIAWLTVRHQGMIDAWLVGERYYGKPVPIRDEVYLVYGPRQDPTTFRSEYLRTALDISDVEYAGTAILLLNPRIVTPEGEWEAWFHAHWLPGANRYRSFQELMLAQYESFRLLEAQE